MKRIGIFTTFGGWDEAYSPCNVVKHQLIALVKHGYSPVLFTLENFPKDIAFDGVEVRRVIPVTIFEPYVGIATHRNVPNSLEKDVAKIVPAYNQHFKDIDVMLCHDVIFQDSFFAYNVALHKMVMRKDQIFYHWMHSGPSLRPNPLEYPISCLYSLPPNSRLVYMNQYDIVRAGEMYGVYPNMVRIVHNPIDPLTDATLHPLTKQIYEQGKLYDADVIGVYPLSTTRMSRGGKQLDKAIKIMGYIKKQGQKVRYIIPNAHANAQKEKDAIEAMYTFAKSYGLEREDLIFTSLIDKQWEHGIPHDVVLQLFGLSDVFLFPSVSENCPLVLLEAAAKKNLLVLNEDFSPMKDFVGGDALYFKFDSVTTVTNHPRGEDTYYEDVAKITLSELSANRVYRSSVTTRQRFNIFSNFKNELEPLLYEGTVPEEREPMELQEKIKITEEVEVAQDIKDGVNITYTEREEKQDFPDFDKVFKRFKDTGVLKDPVQIRMYEAISKGWCIGKAVLDAGCGMGIGTNILGREALGAWGVDVYSKNIDVAKQFFQNMRVKFEVVDLVKPPDRPFATFDVVVCIEVIEHVKEFEILLNTLKSFYDPKRKTVFFISSPNRNNDKLGKETPNNEYHCREWSAGEFYEVLIKHFKSVVLYSGPKLDTFSMEETVDGNTMDTPILAKVEEPI